MVAEPQAAGVGQPGAAIGIEARVVTGHWRGTQVGPGWWARLPQGHQANSGRTPRPPLESVHFLPEVKAICFCLHCSEGAETSRGGV